LFVDIQVAQTVGGAGNLQIGAGLFENVISGIDNLLLTVTQTVGLSALAPIISYQRYINAGDSTITHTAGIVINGLQITGAGVLNVTNNYQLLVNSSQQFASTSTVTNRWGIYQAGVNDYNYFASKVLIGTTTSDTNAIKVNGSALLDYAFIGQVSGYGNTFTQFSHNSRNGAGEYSFLSENFGTTIINAKTNFPVNLRINNITKVTLSPEGCLLINTVTNTTRQLVVNGQQEWLTTVGTGAHTTSGNHLPIWVNGVQYWLALLNPPILP
jgi:hypothetical protein